MLSLIRRQFSQEKIQSHPNFSGAPLIHRLRTLWMLLGFGGLVFHSACAATKLQGAEDCDARLLQRSMGLEVRFGSALRNGVVGQSVKAPIVVRFPSNGAEVHSAPEIQCQGFIPNGAQITHLQITRVTGLPPGVTWRSFQATSHYKGGETACFWVEGTPEAAGTYVVQTHVTGTGRYLGLTSTARCILRIEATVKSR